MITEDYISFETAKLLKEKGFNEACHAYYDGGHRHLLKFAQNGLYNNAGVVANKGICVAPTHQMAMKWLRKVHELDMDISIEYIPKKAYYYSILKKTVIRDIDCLHSETNFMSYEQACEAAIKYCIENLI